MATSWATSPEKSYRISMPRCLPTSAAEWIPGVAAARRRGSFDFFRATRRNSWETSGSSQLPGETPPQKNRPIHLLAHRRSSRDFEAQSWIKVLLAYICILFPRVTSNSHVFARAAPELGTLARCTHKLSRKSSLWPIKVFFGEFEIII